jgi:hypothetical protein
MQSRGKGCSSFRGDSLNLQSQKLGALPNLSSKMEQRAHRRCDGPFASFVAAFGEDHSGRSSLPEKLSKTSARDSAHSSRRTPKKSLLIVLVASRLSEVWVRLGPSGTSARVDEPLELQDAALCQCSQMCHREADRLAIRGKSES